MKFTKLYFAMIGLLIAFGFQSCNNSETSIVDENLIEGNNSRVRITLVDAPGTYDNVFVNIVDVQYNSSEDEEGWKSFPEPEGGYPDQIDLCTLVGGDYYLLADVIIESKILKQIRIVLGDNNEVVEDGTRHDLKTPSAQQSGLKIKLDAELEPGFSYDFTLDWDVDKSIVKTGKSGKYILKPVIHASSKVNSGSISGVVVERLSESETKPIKGALVKVYNTNGIYFTTSRTDDSGSFMLQGLKPEEINTFVLKITHPDYEEYNTPEGQEITVEKGLVTVLIEDIELLLPKSIIGKVIDTDGDVEGAMVDVFSTSDDRTSLGSFTTFSDGNFFFRGLTAGDYVLKIVGPDGDDEGVESDYEVYDTPGDETITVNDGETTNVGNIDIEKL